MSTVRCNPNLLTLLLSPIVSLRTSIGDDGGDVNGLEFGQYDSRLLRETWACEVLLAGSFRIMRHLVRGGTPVNLIREAKSEVVFFAVCLVLAIPSCSYTIDCQGRSTGIWESGIKVNATGLESTNRPSKASKLTKRAPQSGTINIT